MNSLEFQIHGRIVNRLKYVKIMNFLKKKLIYKRYYQSSRSPQDFNNIWLKEEPMILPILELASYRLITT